MVFFNTRKRKLLAGEDAAWLHMHAPTNPMSIMQVLVFEQPIDFEELLSRLQHRWLDNPRFRQKIQRPRSGAPEWIDDPHFDLRAHVRKVSLSSPAGVESFQDFLSDLMSSQLDLARAAWTVHVVESFRSVSGQVRSALVLRVHHAYGDIFAISRAFMALLDDSHNITQFPLSVAHQQPPAFYRNSYQLKQSWRESWVLQSLKRLKGGVATLRDPVEAARIARSGMGAASEVATIALLEPDQSTPLKQPVTLTKRIAVCPDGVALAEMRDIGKAYGVRTNLVVLAALAGALRRFMRHDLDHDPTDVRFIVDIDLRDQQAVETEQVVREYNSNRLGNRFGVAVLQLPLGVENPIERIYVLKQRMAALETSLQPQASFGMLQVFGRGTSTLQKSMTEVFTQKVSGVMASIPGCRNPAFLGNNRLVSWHTWEPVPGDIGLSVGLTSYDEQLFLSVLTDAAVSDSPSRVVEYFHEEVARLARVAIDPQEALLETSSAGTE